MRKDTAHLLATLSQPEFLYREFQYTFYVNSGWSLFSSLLGDPRLLGRAICAEKIQLLGENAAPTAETGPDPIEAAPLLERYSVPVAPPPEQQRAVDLRGFFTSFSESE